MIVKCSECGNTFKIEKPSEGDLVACPVCEADYTVAVQAGNVKLKAFIYEGEDPGEL